MTGPTDSRQTKYSIAVYDALQGLGHATNAQILIGLHRSYPEVSATTVHRVTARLKAQGRIGCAPKAVDGSERYDSNAAAHHHFACTACDRLCDMPETDALHSLTAQLKQMSGECAVAGSLTLSGVCRKCEEKNERILQ